MTCTRSQGFLAKVKADVAEQVNASKQKLGRREALELARQATEVIVAKGKKLTMFDMRKAPPEDEDLAAAILGPTGNLRAPTFRVGTKLYVGFNEEEFGPRLQR